jgi:phage-related baseplate assembly protein
MSRFVAPDLSRLPAPSALEALDFEALVTARLGTLKTRAEARGFPYDVETLESDPLVIDQQTGAVHELMVRSRVNDAVRAVLLVTATGVQLDHIAATYYGISRLVVTAAIGNQPAVTEADADFRARIALAVEAWSTAGPEGAYIFHALEADGSVLDVAVYSEEDGAVYANSTPVLAPEVLVVVLSRVGNGTPSSELLANVLADLSGREVRPIGDKVVVEPAIIVPYAVSATLKVRAGADASLLVAEARSRVEAYVAARRRVGAIVQRLGLGAALKVTDVEEIVLSSPAADVDPGSKGAGFCTGITITAEAAEDSWR